MLWKLLLTAAVILGAYLVIRARMRQPEHSAPERRPRLPRGFARTLAYVLVGLSLGGTGFYLIHSWSGGREVLRVQVVNANTGVAIDYLARRKDIDGRGFRTLEGQVIRLADVERMVLSPAAPETPP
ncbi:MAG: hypothetical protein ACM3ST_02295 [Bdellovibrio bacteriovorus]